jgi:lysophospholipase L1-like esterase
MLSHRRLLLILSLAPLVASAKLGEEQTGKLRAEIRTDRILFLGNSITRHGPAPKIGWNDDWGMAASALEKDYVHLVAGGISELAGKKPEIRTANIADFERNLATYDVDAKLKAEFEFKPTLVIVAIGENVAALRTEEAKAQFGASFKKLLGAVKNTGQPALIVRSCFWPDKTKDEILQQACAAAGGTFVDIRALGRDESNYARSERKIEHAGVAAHPGDKGMKAIADAILNALKTAGK